MSRTSCSLGCTSLAALILLTTIAAAPSHASVLYFYEGNLFTNLRSSGPTTPTTPYTSSHRVTAFLEFDLPLAANVGVMTTITPLRFGFADGLYVITSSTANSGSFKVTTDADGNITTWDMFVRRSSIQNGVRTDYTIATTNWAQMFFVADYAIEERCGPGSTSTTCVQSGDPSYEQSGSNRLQPGVWTLRSELPPPSPQPPPSVPEPVAVMLLGVALAGLGARLRRIGKL